MTLHLHSFLQYGLNEARGYELYFRIQEKFKFARSPEYRIQEFINLDLVPCVF